MQRLQNLLLILLFLAISAVKLLIPQQAEALRTMALELAYQDYAYVETIAYMGEQLAQQGLGGGLVSVFRGENPADFPVLPEATTAFLEEGASE